MLSIKKIKILTDGLIISVVSIVCYHTGGSMKLNARILHLAYMVYLYVRPGNSG
jgi:hypothetical protein